MNPKGFNRDENVSFRVEVLNFGFHWTPIISGCLLCWTLKSKISGELKAYQPVFYCTSLAISAPVPDGGTHISKAVILQIRKIAKEPSRYQSLL